MDKGQLIIGTGEQARVYKPQLRAPSMQDFLACKPEYQEFCCNIPITAGEPCVFNDQTFTAYSAIVANFAEANAAFYKVKSMNAAARHIYAAIRLPHCDDGLLEDCYDDDEHGGGLFVLRLLREAQIVNRVVFVVRQYDGSHINEQRWLETERAIISAVARSAKNKYTGSHQIVNPTYSNRQDRRKHRRGGKYQRGPNQWPAFPPSGNRRASQESTPTDDVDDDVASQEGEPE